MVARHFLDDRSAPVIFKHDEMADQIKKPALVEHAAEQHFQLRHGDGRNRLAFNCPPRHEAFLVRADRADAGFNSV